MAYQAAYQSRRRWVEGVYDRQDSHTQAAFQRRFSCLLESLVVHARRLTTRLRDTGKLLLLVLAFHPIPLCVRDAAALDISYHKPLSSVLLHLQTK